METFLEEELHDMLIEIKKLKRQVYEINKERIKLEKEYNLKFCFIDWKKKEGKYFLVKGSKKEIFYCHVLKVTEELKRIEYIDKQSCAIDEITDPEEEPGFKSWLEISKEEYQKHLK